jgi:hypothetical protein
MGWCKSIIECCLDNNPSKEISFDRISQKMFKYYWNQTIFFNLQQSPNPNKPPEFISYVKKKIVKLALKIHLRHKNGHINGVKKMVM